MKEIRPDWGPKESYSGVLDLGDIVVVRLAPANFRVTFPDGRSADRASNLGAVPYAPATRFAVENLQTCRMVSILVESKRKGAQENAGSSRIDPLTSDPLLP